jgi:hypothetical protein
MYNTYNSGMTVGVKPVAQMGRSDEFYSAAGNGGINNSHTIQQTSTTGYRPSSVLDPVIGNPNGQSSTTQQANRALNYYRQ